VEFSGTGNACYVYQADQSPFDPDKSVLELASELKQPNRALDRMRHSPAPSRPNRIEGWLSKFDDALEKLGIRVQSQVGAPGSAKPLAFEDQVRDALKSVKHKVYDQRARGGAFQVQLDDNDQAAVAALQRLGFKPVNQQPLRFWRQ